MPPVGAGDWNKEPGTFALEFAGTSELGLLPKWQLSQLLPLLEGIWEVAPGEPVGGRTMMLVIP
ncbi:MAG: hypothetical protein WCH60_15180 [Burkholderiales bacterium]